jgi:2-keto-3-deoxy-galactonokinase
VSLVNAAVPAVSSENRTPGLIGLDWGTSSCRAYLLGALAESEVTDYLSGMIIGAEPAGAQARTSLTRGARS